jgi:CheY-like chemotaxis protein
MGEFDGLGPNTSQDGTGSREYFYEGAVAGATALIVEDDSGNAFALAELLKRGRMTVVAVDSGPAALDMLKRRDDIGIVLMDIMMPMMDGYETMMTIRNRVESADIPIIAVTSKTVDGERERCLAAGASAFFSKPVDTASLLTAVSQWLPAAAASASDASRP